MTRGGKRLGAGRTRILSFYDRFQVVMEYQRRWSELQHNDLAMKSEKIGEISELAENWRDAVMKANTPSRRERAVELSEIPENLWPKTLSDRMQDAASGLVGYQRSLEQLTDKLRGKGHSAGLRIAGKRPHGKRAGLERDVAEWASERFEKQITARYVRRCVDDWQRDKSL